MYKEKNVFELRPLTRYWVEKTNKVKIVFLADVFIKNSNFGPRKLHREDLCKIS